MRIFDSDRAIQNQRNIKDAIFQHLHQVTTANAPLPSLNLFPYGIRLEPEDFALERNAKWTKRQLTEYREEAVILAGLWGSIAVRLNNKRRLRNLQARANRDPSPTQ